MFERKRRYFSEGDKLITRLFPAHVFFFSPFSSEQSLERERRVFAVDMRNHGSSSHHDSMTYVDMADDVLGFMADQVSYVASSIFSAHPVAFSGRGRYKGKKRMSQM